MESGNKARRRRVSRNKRKLIWKRKKQREQRTLLGALIV